MYEQQIISGLLEGYHYAHTRVNWVFPLHKALAGLSAEDASWKPEADESSIWDIANHMLNWTRFINTCLKGETVQPETDWPQAGHDEQAWQRTTEELFAELETFRTRLEQITPDQLFDPLDRPDRFDRILCLYIHNAYHAGQIEKLRERRFGHEAEE